jgi:hypothetical protein
LAQGGRSAVYSDVDIHFGLYVLSEGEVFHWRLGEALRSDWRQAVGAKTREG